MASRLMMPLVADGVVELYFCAASFGAQINSVTSFGGLWRSVLHVYESRVYA
jgi:hypothetical protein